MRAKKAPPACESDSEFKAKLKRYSQHRAQVSPLEELASLELEPATGDTVLVAVPVIRHWLFAPDRTKARVRKFCVDVKHRKKRVTQTFCIGDPTAPEGKGYGVLTTKHQKALLVLQELWQEQRGRMALWQGRRQGFVSASSWDLEERLFGSHGGRQKTMVRQLIQELASIPVAITNYIGPNQEIQDVDMTGLISGAMFGQSRKKTSPNQLGFPWVEIALGDVVTQAFEMSAIKPLNLAAMNNLRDIAALLYPKLDYLLSHNEEVNFRLPTLVSNLGLTGEVERHRSRRRRLFTPAAAQLDGLPLSIRGRSLQAHIVHAGASDGEDIFTASY